MLIFFLKWTMNSDQSEYEYDKDDNQEFLGKNRNYIADVLAM